MTNLTHAGGLVYKIEDTDTLYLLVTAKGSSSEWVLPKGHIETGETPEFAAVREVIEEAGILARPEKIITHLHYIKGIEKVFIQYYLMKFVMEVITGSESRTRKWVSKEQAINLLSFEDTREVLLKLQ
ncbi:MAG: NUDIX domain-containing protein [Chitinophagaceae bacterium]